MQTHNERRHRDNEVTEIQGPTPHEKNHVAWAQGLCVRVAVLSVAQPFQTESLADLEVALRLSVSSSRVLGLRVRVAVLSVTLQTISLAGPTFIKGLQLLYDAVAGGASDSCRIYGFRAPRA